MKKRWNASVKTATGEVVSLIVRGQTEKEAMTNAEAYAGVKEVYSVVERVVERTFPDPPADKIDIHYRPLRNKKVLFG